MASASAIEPNSGAATPAGSSQATATSPGSVIARVSQLGAGRAVAFNDPITGDPGVLLKLSDGSIVAFDAVCTHAGCTVEYDPSYRLLVCPCHGAAFDPAQHGAVLGGPTNQPLLELPISIDRTTGQIILTG